MRRSGTEQKTERNFQQFITSIMHCRSFKMDRVYLFYSPRVGIHQSLLIFYCFFFFGNGCCFSFAYLSILILNDRYFVVLVLCGLHSFEVVVDGDDRFYFIKEMPLVPFCLIVFTTFFPL